MSTADSSGVLVGVDGSPGSIAAVDWAAIEAFRTGQVLTVCCVLAHGQAPSLPTLDLPEADRDTRSRGEEVTREAAARARRVWPHLPVVEAVTEGRAADELCGRAADARLLVIGAGGHGGLPGLLLGSVSARVTARATVPVVVVRGRLPGLTAPVVVGVDGSPDGEPAVAFGFDWAYQRGVRLVAVTLVDPRIAVPSPGWTVVPDLLDSQDEARARQDEALRIWRDKYPDVWVERRVELGLASHALVAASTGSSLVVVGSRGHGGFAGLLLGSVGQHVLRHAACPVVVAR